MRLLQVLRPSRSSLLALALPLAAALAPACSGPSRPAGAPPATPPATAAPDGASGVGTVQLTVTAAPDRELPALTWYPARGAGANAPPVLGRKLPVLVMSHGLNGRKEHAAFIAQRVAAAGYLVVAADHVNDSVASAPLRPVDITKLLDRLADRGAAPAWLADLADLEHVAVYGHSFGGYTGLAVAGAKVGPNPEWTALCAATPATFGCPAPTPATMPAMTYRDRRVDAVIAAAPAGFFQFGRAGTAAIETPVVVLAGGKDELTTLAEYVRPLYQHVTRPRWLVELPLAGHMTFIDLCAKVDRLPPPFKAEVAAQCAPDAPLPLAAAHALIADAVVASLDHLLRGGPAPDFAALAKARGVEVRVEAAP